MPTALLLPLRAGTDPREKVGCINTMDNKYVADFPTRCRFLTSLKSVFLIGIHVEASGIFLVICERVQTRWHTDSTDEIFLLKGDEWRFFFFFYERWVFSGQFHPRMKIVEMSQG